MSRRLAALGAVALTTAAVAVPALAQSGNGNGNGNTTTVTFTELGKGSTFHFVDLPPRTKLSHGNPKKISAGDEFVTTSNLADSAGTRIGQLRAVCQATRTTRRFDKAGFICTGDFVFTDGSSMTAHVADLGGDAGAGGRLARDRVGGRARHEAIFGDQLAGLGGEEHGQVLGIVELLPVARGGERAKGGGQILERRHGVTGYARSRYERRKSRRAPLNSAG